MSRATVLVIATAALLVSTTARAQSWEASGLVGYTPSADLDRVARELDQLTISGGFTWLAQAARFFSSRWGVEALWTQQSSALRIDSGADREGSSGSPQLVK